MVRSLTTLIVIFGAAIASAIWVGNRAAREVEAETANRAAAALRAAGRSWARAAADGATLTLTGTAISEARRNAAIAELGAAAPWASIRNEASVAERPPAFQPAPELRFLRGVGDVTITGAAPVGTARLSEKLSERAPRLAITDLTRRDAADPPEGWERAGEAALEIASDLLHGGIALSPGDLSVHGLAADEAALARIAARMAALEQSGWSTSTNLAAPPPPAAAFEMKAEMTETGGALIACAAMTPAEADEILAEATELFAEAPEACLIGAGAPDADWTRASIAAMRAVASLPAGRIALVGRRARLTASPPTRLKALAVARRALSSELPQVYRLAVLSTPGDDAPARSDAAAPGETGETMITISDGVLRLSGEAPNRVLADAISAMARAGASGVAVVNDLTPGGAGNAAEWRAAMATILGAMHTLNAGEARLAPGLAVVSGAVSDPADIRPLHRLIARGVGDSRRIITRFRVSPASRAALQALPPGRCAARLNRIVAGAPIAFEPGSTRIDEASLPVIKLLRDALTECGGGAVEIGGHTDSQGSARLNEGLSRSRAFAVLDALVKAGADPAMLTAEGYGEANPVADNATEEGRAQNRRIEFRAAPDAVEEEG